MACGITEYGILYFQVITLNSNTLLVVIKICYQMTALQLHV